MIVHPAKAYLLRDYEQFMAHLAASREDQRLTWAQVGERANCHLQQAWNWMNGGAECRARRLFSLAHAFDYDLALIPKSDADPACDCGHQGLDAMFHLTPCPVALLRRRARALGYDLALIPREDA